MRRKEKMRRKKSMQLILLRRTGMGWMAVSTRSSSHPHDSTSRSSGAGNNNDRQTLCRFNNSLYAVIEVRRKKFEKFSQKGTDRQREEEEETHRARRYESPGRDPTRGRKH